MSSFAKPNLLISKCLGFDACRHDGAVIGDDYVAALRPFVRVTTVCPEEEIGLGTPRDILLLVRRDGGDRMVQPGTGRDVTMRMERFAPFPRQLVEITDSGKGRDR